MVKNVAGYDLPKVFVGSQGTLGLICDVTLKLAPLPRQRRTLVVPIANPAVGLGGAGDRWHLAGHGRRGAGAGGRPASLPRADGLLAITLEGLPEDVAEEEQALRDALSAAGARRLQPWISRRRQTFGQSSWAARLPHRASCGWACRRSTCRPTGRCVGQLHRPEMLPGVFDAAAGLAYATGKPDCPLTAEWVTAVRQPAVALGGYGVVMAATPGLTDPIVRGRSASQHVPLDAAVEGA